MKKSTRANGAIKFASWGVVAALGGILVYWLNVHWNRIPVGGGLIAIGFPGALAITGLLEMVTGLPFLSLASKWEQLAGWQRGVVGILVVSLAIVVFMGGIILFA